MSYSKRINDSGLKGIPELAFNNTYDVDFVNDQTRRTRDMLYTRCLEVQKRLCGINIVAGKMNEFKENASLARTFNLPVSTFFTRIQNQFLNFFSEKEALYTLALKEDPIGYPTPDDIAKGYPFSPYYSDIIPKQGSQYRKYDLYEVCKSNRLFKRRLLFYIKTGSSSGSSIGKTDGTILYMNLLVIPTRGSTYLAIQVTGDKAFNKAKLQTLIENQADWYLYESKAGNFWKNDNYSKTDFVSYDNKYYMKHVFPDKSGENKEMGSNVYLIGLEDPHYPNTYQVFISSWKSPTETISGYELSSSSITSWTGKNVIVLNEREVGYLVNVMSRVNSTMRLDSPTGVFQLDLKENPIPPENILVYVLDSDTNAAYPVPNAEITMWYPNVYRIDMKELEYDNQNLQIIAYYSNETSTTFTNPIANYMEFRGDQYINDCINETLPSPISTYIPYPETFSIDDYMKSKYYPLDKPYQYIMDKDIWMLLDDPNRYDDLFEKVTRKLTRHNTYQYIYNSRDIDMENRYVLDNHAQITNQAKWVTFDQEMAFIVISIHSSEPVPVLLFINGLRMLDLHIFVEGHLQYIYFDSMTFSDNSEIIVEILDVHDTDIIQAPLKFDSVGKDVPFPENFDHFADQNLIFYDADTKEIIPNSDFSYGIFINLEKDHILTSNKEYLKTVNDEFVITGSHINLTSAPGGIGSGFYKNVGTRLSIQNIELVGTTIYQTVYRDNHSLISNPENQKTWTEDMLCFDITAYEAFYPSTLKVDEVEVPFDEVYRYFQYDLTNKVMKEYVFFPKRYATSSSLLTLSTLIASKWEFLKNEVNFGTTGELCISTNNINNVNRNIIVQATDFYKTLKTDVITSSRENEIVIPNFYGQPVKDRFRLWRTTKAQKAVVPDDYIFGKRLELDDYEFIFPDTVGGDLVIRFNGLGLAGATLLFEYMPFRSRVCATHQDISPDPDNVINFFDVLERPVNLEYYEIYADGIRLSPKYIKPFTPTHIQLNQMYLDTTASVVVVEKRHDSDVYGNRYRKMTLEEQLMYIDTDFREYMRDRTEFE